MGFRKLNHIQKEILIYLLDREIERLKTHIDFNIEHGQRLQSNPLMETHIHMYSDIRKIILENEC